MLSATLSPGCWSPRSTSVAYLHSGDLEKVANKFLDSASCSLLSHPDQGPCAKVGLHHGAARRFTVIPCFAVRPTHVSRCAHFGFEVSPRPQLLCSRVEQ